MRKLLRKNLYLFFGWIFLGLAILGIPLPLLPTTPFVLLAAFFFSKGSARIHQWLLSNKLFGEQIKKWEQTGSISIRSKVIAITMLWLSMGYPLCFIAIPMLLKFLIILIGISITSFLVTRPS